jgi:hypothetical protein
MHIHYESLVAGGGPNENLADKIFSMNIFIWTHAGNQGAVRPG